MLDCPYKGLIPYLEEDAEFFFGREDDIKSIINNLKTRRLTALYGESGVGKSSVLRAGAVYKLRQETVKTLKKDKFLRSVVVIFPPDPSTSDRETPLEKGDFSWQDDPLVVLKKQIEIEIKKNIPNIQSPEINLPFVETLQVWTEGTDSQEGCGKLLIILDQFEQYFLYHPQKNKESKFDFGLTEFDSEFVRAVNNPKLRVNFLISIREDELAKLDRFQEDISNLSNNYLRLEHLNRQFAHDAIVKPIAKYNGLHAEESINFDCQLADMVLDSIAQFVPSADGLAGIEKLKSLDQIEAPYLQLVMQHLWKEMKEKNSRCLTIDTLINLADKNAKDNHKKLWTAVKNIVQDHLIAAVAPLSESERDVAVSIFRYLVTPSGLKYAYSISDLYERYKEEQESAHASTETIDVLEELLEMLAKGDNRILRPMTQLPDQPISAKRYEIFHDVLARPILDWRKDYLERKRLEQQKQGEKVLRTHTIKKELAVQSLRQNLLRHSELAALLARQAYRFNQEDELLLLDRVDDALRQVLSASHFSNILKEYSSAFSSISFSPDGTKLAAASLDGKIFLWNRVQHYSEFTLNDHDENSGCAEEVYSLAFSPDGNWLASANLGNTTIRLWDLHQENPVSTVIGNHAKGVTCLAFSSDENLLASGSEDQTVKLWHWQQPDPAPIVLKGHSLKGQMGIVRSLAFGPDRSPDGSKLLDGSRLAVGCDDRAIWLWDVQEPAQTPDKEPVVRYGHEEKVNAVAFSPDGQTLASASDDRTIRLWDVSRYRGAPKVLQKHTEQVKTLTFSPDGKILASASGDQTIRLWDVSQPEKESQVIRGHTFDITSVAFSPDSQFLASASEDNTVRLWDLHPPSAAPKVLQGHQEKVHSIAISSQNQQDQLLASGGEDGTVRVWVWNNDQPDAEPKIFKVFKRCGKVFGVALFVSDDRQTQLLAAGSADHIIRLWDLKQPPDVPPRELRGHRDGVSSVAFSPDGKWLASGSWEMDRTVRLWNLDQPDAESIPCTGKGHTESVTSVTFSPDGKTLASASDDKTILLWNVEQPDADPTSLKNHNGRVWSIAFNPNGTLLASASDDWEVQLWNLENLDPQDPVHVRLKGHSAWVSSVAFSPDGKILASGSFDRSIRLWRINQIDWESGEIKEAPVILENHNQSITSVAFTSDGKHLVSGSYDHTVRLWIASTDVLAEMVCQKVFRNLTRKEWEDFLSVDIPYKPT